MHSAGHPKPLLWDKPDRCGAEGGGGGIQDGQDACTVMVDSCWCMAKAVTIL